MEGGGDTAAPAGGAPLSALWDPQAQAREHVPQPGSRHLIQGAQAWAREHAPDSGSMHLIRAREQVSGVGVL